MGEGVVNQPGALRRRPLRTLHTTVEKKKKVNRVSKRLNTKKIQRGLLKLRGKKSKVKKEYSDFLCSYFERTEKV